MTKSGYRFWLPILVIVAALCCSFVSIAENSSSEPGQYKPPSEQSSDSTSGTLLYSDDFSNKSSGWKRVSTSVESFAYKDEKYKIKINELDDMASSYIPGDLIFDDFAVEVDTSFEQLDEENTDDYAVGLFLRNLDGDNYRFLISAEGDFYFSRYKNKNLEPIIDWTASDAINTGLGNNTLKVVCNGDEFTFYVNGIEIGSCADSGLSSGEIGLHAETWDSIGLVASFDNLKVSEVSGA